MLMNRRTFLGASASIAVAGQMWPSAAERNVRRACIIGDTREGGYGHSLHKVWACREDVMVVGLADPDEAGRAKHAEEAKAQRQYSDYREMLDKEKPELIAIGPRWTTRHQEYLAAAAACGAHGIMEKPISSDLQEADAMIALIEPLRLKWAIGFNFRATPMIQFVKKTVFEQGIIGEVLEVRSRGKEDQRAGGEDMLVLGTHLFDMMRFFLGPALWCMADITVEGRPATLADRHDATEPVGKVVGDRIHAMFGFEGGITGHFASTRNQQGNGNRWGMDIYGSKGVVTIRQDGGPRVRYWPQPSWDAQEDAVQWQALPGAPDTAMKDPQIETYAPIVHDLITAIEQDRLPAVSLQDGRNSLEMVQAVYAAHFAGGRVALPLADRLHPLAKDIGG